MGSLEDEVARAVLPPFRCRWSSAASRGPPLTVLNMPTNGNLDRWDSFRHVQGYAGSVPETERSGKHLVVKFRFACNTPLRDALHQLAFLSLSHSVWARAYYDGYRARNHTHHQALRALGAKWLKIIFVNVDTPCALQ